ncbi:hypothetical protein [Melittangium boletus]|uniref:Ricin B lectin domain-containing protein n=1 Tax=Melittangium boletus DSM 14713 TaxID=1294270 RepID=A0A250IFB5_9BACT|nr:hypothetical protein [Melittangium boletus]ATB29841.1 hypothetical protein MEBOL_003296 [Melittangium boletus DSM 14713]
MSPFKRRSCLSVFVSVLGAMAAGAVPLEEDRAMPGGGFPSPDRDFLLVNVGFSLCLTVVDGQVEGLPCVWDGAPLAQRWRYQDQQLISLMGGECFLAPSLVPCQYTRSFDVTYDLLTQHLVLTPRGALPSASCHVMDQDLHADASTGGGEPRYVPLRASLESNPCAVSRASSRWVIVPVSP